MLCPPRDERNNNTPTFWGLKRSNSVTNLTTIPRIKLTVSSPESDQNTDPGEEVAQNVAFEPRVSSKDLGGIALQDNRGEKERAFPRRRRKDSLAQTNPDSLGALLTVPRTRSRKFSLPVLGPRQPLGLSPSLSPGAPLFDASRKRLSQVGLAVSHHFQSTIGWKISANQTEIIEQGKCFCARYIRFKLRKCGLVHKKMGLQRLRSLGNLYDDQYMGQISLIIKYLIQELERLYPKLYQSVTSNIGNTASIFASSTSVHNIHQLIAREIFRNDISWTRIVAFLATTGALSVDCVRAGHPEYVIPLLDSFTAFLERDLASWISQQGGWETLVHRFRSEDEWMKTLKFTLLSISIVFWVILAYCML